MSRPKRYLQSCLKTLVLNRVFSNPSAPYVSQLLFTRMFLECLWHSNKLIERGKQDFGTQNTFKFNWISIAGHLSFSIHSLGWQRISWADSIYCFVSWPWWSMCLALISHSYDNINVPTRIGIFGTAVVLQLHNTPVYPRELVSFFFTFRNLTIFPLDVRLDCLIRSIFYFTLP